METFVQQILNGLVLGSMYALVALGYTMVYGVLNLINFAHGDVLMIGAMVGLSILKLLDSSFRQACPAGVQLAIAIVGAIPVAMLVNVLIERVAYRRLRNAPRLAPLITAIGVSILLQTFAMMIWGRSPLPFPQLLSSEPLTGRRRRHFADAGVVAGAGGRWPCSALVFLVEKTKHGARHARRRRKPARGGA